MVKTIKRWIYKLLGQDRYLQLLGTLFPLSYRMGLLAKDPIYDFHYYVRHLIRPGFTVVDIGANMGYYTQIFAELTGPNGKVIAFEPVPPFFKAMKRVADKYPHCIAHPYALGEEEKAITLSVPNDHGYLRTGLASIEGGGQEGGDFFHFPAEMSKGSTLLAGEQRIDYIKCDIEGYETVVIPELQEIIKKHRPMIQIETYGAQQDFILPLLKSWGYSQFSLHQHALIKDLPLDKHFGDFLFIFESS